MLENTMNPLADEYTGPDFSDETINNTCSMVDTSGYDDFMDEVERSESGLGQEELDRLMAEAVN